MSNTENTTENDIALTPAPATNSIAVGLLNLAKETKRELESGELTSLAETVPYEFTNRENAKIGQAFTGIYLGGELKKSLLNDGTYTEYKFLAIERDGTILNVPHTYVLSGVLAEKSFGLLSEGSRVRVEITGKKRGKGEYFTFSVILLGTGAPKQ